MPSDNNVAFEFDAKSILGPIMSVVKSWDSMVGAVKKGGAVVENKLGSIAEKFSNVKKSVSQKIGSGISGPKDNDTDPKDGLKNIGKQGKDSGNIASKAADTVKASWTKVIGTLAAVGISFAALKSTLASMPEVSQTLNVVGRTFMMNFLNPIRQELLPLLNKVLRWTSDNRGEFVKWGSTVLSIFKAAISIAKSFLDIFKIIIDEVGSTIEGTFGNFFTNLDDTIKLILTKVATTIIFISVLLKPLLKSIGSAVGKIAVAGKGLWDGFIEGALGSFEPLSKISIVLSEIINLLFGANTSTDELYNTFKAFGNFLGNVFSGIIDVISKALEYVLIFGKGLVDGFNYIEKSEAISFLVDSIMDLIGLFKSLFSETETLDPVFSSLGKIIGGALGLAIKALAYGIGLIIKGIVLLLEKAGPLIPVFIKLLKIIDGGIVKAFVYLKEIALDLYNFLADKFASVWGGIGEDMETLSRAASYIGGAFRGMKNYLYDFASYIGSKVSGPIKSLSAKLKSMGSDISSFFSGVFGYISKKIKEALGWFSSISKKMKDIKKDLEDWLGSKPISKDIKKDLEDWPGSKSISKDIKKDLEDWLGGKSISNAINAMLGLTPATATAGGNAPTIIQQGSQGAQGSQVQPSASLIPPAISGSTTTTTTSVNPVINFTNNVSVTSVPQNLVPDVTSAIQGATGNASQTIVDDLNKSLLRDGK